MENKTMEFMKNYAEWNKQAEEEVKQLFLNGKLGNPESVNFKEIRFNEEGLVFQMHTVSVAGNVKIPSTIQKTVFGKLVTPWKDSEYYIEL